MNKIMKNNQRIKNMKIGIIGFGILGKALNHVFNIKFPIYIYDKYQEQYNDISPLAENADIIFLAVPTPMKPSGEIDLNYVEDALRIISNAVKKKKKPHSCYTFYDSSRNNRKIAKKIPQYSFDF